MTDTNRSFTVTITDTSTTSNQTTDQTTTIMDSYRGSSSFSRWAITSCDGEADRANAIPTSLLSAPATVIHSMHKFPQHNNNINNNNNSKTMFMVLSSWQSHCESSPSSFDKCGMAPSGRRPKIKPGDLGCESACTGCQNLHPPSPFIITQPESWHSFYRPMEGRRLSRPSCLVKYRDGLPAYRRSPILVLTGSDAVQLRYVLPLCQTANCGIWCQMFMWLRSTQVDSCIMPRMHSPSEASLLNSRRIALWRLWRS